MNVNRLYEILEDTTVQLRKGAVVEREHVGDVVVEHVYAMPHVDDLRPDGTARVDCIFIDIGVDKAKAEQHRDELMALLRDYPDQLRLASGPSYIEVGSVIGDQGAAFQLFAMGHVLGLWKLITPRTLGITDDAHVRALAGQGMIMMSGYKTPI